MMDNLKVIANEVLPVLENDIGDKFVNGRQLHEKMMVRRDFTTWIKDRIDQYGFIEGEDYFLTLTKIGERQNVTRHEYFLSLDTAKEIAMVQNNEAGRAVRKYFIKVEKQFRKQNQEPKTQAEMMLMAAQQMVAQEKRINRLESNLAAAHHRIDNFDRIDTIGNKQQRFNKMIRLYAAHEGLTFPQAWRNFRQAFNTAYHENLTARIDNYKKNHGIRDLSMPKYLSRVDRLDDAIRVADKLINHVHSYAK